MTGDRVFVNLGCTYWCDGGKGKDFLRNLIFVWDGFEQVWMSKPRGAYWLCGEHYIQWLFSRIAVVDLDSSLSPEI